MSDVTIRRVEQGDLGALTDIYNHYIRETPITFEIEPRSLAQRKQWLDGFAASGRYQCFVAARDGKAVGWASSHRYNERPAYDTTVACGIYLAPDMTGRGLGRRLYITLFEALAGEDIHRLFAGVTQPNEASVGLHRALGFQRIGIYPEVGRKFGRYWDVATYLRPLKGEA